MQLVYRLDFCDLVRLEYAVPIHIIDCVGIVVLPVYRAVVFVIDCVAFRVHKNAVTMEHAVTHVNQFRAIPIMVFGHGNISRCRA